MVEDSVTEFPEHSSVSIVREIKAPFEKIRNRLSDLSKVWFPLYKIVKKTGNGLGDIFTTYSDFGGVMKYTANSLNKFESSYEVCFKITNLDNKENRLSRYLRNFYFCRTAIRSFDSTVVISWGSWRAKERWLSYGHNLQVQIQKFLDSELDKFAKNN